MMITITNPHKVPGYILVNTRKPWWKNAKKHLLRIGPESCRILDASARQFSVINLDDMLIRFGEDGPLEPLKKYVKLEK